MNRRNFLRIPAGLAVAPLMRAQTSRFVHPGSDGRLVYMADEKGNTIPDFSNCGYMGGGVSPPDVRVAETVTPAAGDAGERIQAAIDKVSKLAVDGQGFRGAVLLKRGRYAVAGAIRIAASGVVRRGEGQGEDGSVLLAAGNHQRTLIEVRGPASGDTAGAARGILDPYVPVGSRSFRLASAKGLRAGDTVIVRRAGNQAWIHFIAMDRIKPRSDGSTHQWQPFNLDFERVITAIDGDRLTVDAPITCAIEERWGGGEVLSFDDRQRIQRVGVENLRGVSEFDHSVKAAYGREREPYFSDERHAWNLVTIDAAANAWARKITALHFGLSCVGIKRAKWVTVQDCECLEMVSILTGSRRYPYSVSGQLCLVERCRADTARHDFAVGSRVCGPNVFLHCAAGKSYATSEPHHRWSVGGLFDNVKANIAIQDRQNYGTGHGWAGANYVVWNCEGSLVCQNPPTAQNWSIGQIGLDLPGAFAPRPPGNWESHGHHVTPRSLYLKQLEDRAPVG